ncbi:P-loop containing nucleoside triphosphate hydrolase [Niallia circulans]|nr:P-loop containing nucleoside triphosphate hydrolase [Niallia circulans]
MNQAEVRAALTKCGLTTKHIEQIEVLSSGEKAKVSLCKILNLETNLLILNEAASQLYVDAQKEELKRALKEYHGSILMVSHKPDFYRKIATDIWNCEDGQRKYFK